MKSSCLANLIINIFLSDETIYYVIYVGTEGDWYKIKVDSKHKV